MTQDETWYAKYNEVVTFIETNKRNPSKHSDEERGQYLNWLKHNKKLYAAGDMRPGREEKFKERQVLMEEYKRINQWN